MPIVKIDDCGKGLNLDSSPDDLPPGAWSGCKNMRFKSGYATRFGGIKRIFGEATIDPVYVTYYQTSDGQRFWIYAGGGKIFAVGGNLTAPKDITPSIDVPIVAARFDISESTQGQAKFVFTFQTKISSEWSVGDTPVIHGFAPDIYNRGGSFSLNAVTTGGSSAGTTYTSANNETTTARSTVGLSPIYHLNGGDRYDINVPYYLFEITLPSSALPALQTAYFSISNDRQIRLDNYVERLRSLYQITRFGYTTVKNPVARTIADAPPSAWSSACFNGFLLLNNGENAMMYWDGKADQVSFIEAPKAKLITSFKSYLLAFGVTKPAKTNADNVTIPATLDSYMFKWSTSAEPGKLPDHWNETDLTRDAGEVDIAETPDHIVDAVPLGDSLIVYKTRSAWTIRFIGNPYIFRVERIPGNIGMFQRGCGVDTPSGNIVVSSGDIVASNGYGFKSIADGRVRRFLFANINATYAANTFVCINQKMNEVLICYPEVGQQYCTKALVWNWSDDAWGMRNLPNIRHGANGQFGDMSNQQWNQQEGSWWDNVRMWGETEFSINEDRVVMAGTRGLYAFDVGGSDDGGVTPLDSYLERTGMDFDEAQSLKLVTEVRPRIEAPVGAVVKVAMGECLLPGQLPYWHADAEFMPDRDIKADAFAQGRRLAVRISCNNAWRMRAFDLEVKIRGKY